MTPYTVSYTVRGMNSTNTPDLATWSVADLRAKIRELAGRRISSVGDERSQYQSVRDWSKAMRPYIEELVRRDQEEQR